MGRDHERYFETDRVKPVLRERAIQGGVVTYLSRIINYLVQMGGTVVLARLLIPEDFGLIAMVTSLNGILLQLRDIGLSDAVIQARSVDQRQMSTLFWINALFNSGLCLSIVALAPLIARFYNEPRLLAITIVLSLSFVFYGLSDLHFALLKRGMHFWSIALAQIVGNVISNVAAILLAWRGYSYWALVVKSVAFAVCMVAVAWIACGWRPGLPVRKSGTRHLISFGANTMGYLTMNFFTRNLDKTIVGWRYGAVPLGYYDKAFNLFLLPISQLAMSLHHVAVTTLSKLRSEPLEYKRYYLRAIEIIAFLGMPVCAYLGSVSEEFIVFLLGPKWIKSAHLFFLLTISGGVHIIYSTHEWLHVSLGRADRWFRWGIIAFVVTVIGYVVGMTISMEAVAIAYSLSIYILTGPALAYAGKPIGLRFREIFASFWRYFLAAAVAGICCRLFLSFVLNYGPLVLRLLTGAAIFVPVYIVAVIGLFRSVAPIVKLISIVASFFRKAPRGEVVR
jgi:O-antigen/teichoic acid export membrane protein